MARFVNITSGRRDGVELLLATLQGLRQEEIAAGNQMIQLKGLEGELRNNEMRHVREMAALAQQQAQFGLDHAYRTRQLEHATEVLNFKRQELDDAKIDRAARLAQTTAGLYEQTVKLHEASVDRGMRITASIRQTEDNLEEQQDLMYSYLGGPVVNSAGQEIPGTFEIKDFRLNQLYESMKDKADGNFPSKQEFVRSYGTHYTVGLENTRGEGKESGIRSATEYATVAVAGQYIPYLGDKAHPELQKAASNLHTDYRKHSGTLKQAFGFDGKGIVFDSKLDNDKLTGNGLVLTAKGLQTNAGISHYAGTYREGRDVIENLSLMEKREHKRRLKMEDRADGLMVQLDGQLAGLLGEDYIKDHPNLGSGDGETGSDGAGGQGSGGSSGGSGSSSGGGSGEAGDQGGGEGERPATVPSSNPRPDPLVPLKQGETPKDDFSLMQDIGYEYKIDPNGNLVAELHDYIDFSGGQERQVTGKTVPITKENFAVGVPKGVVSKYGLGPGQVYDLRAYTRTLERAKVQTEVDKQIARIQWEQQNPQYIDGPWNINRMEPNPADFKSMIDPATTPANQPNQGLVQPGSGYYDSLNNVLLNEARAMGFKNPEVIAHLGAAQSTLESGHGSSIPPGSNNYFGIKGYGREDSVYAMTTEVDDEGREYPTREPFRRFATPTEGARSYLDLIQNDPRYAGIADAPTVEDAIKMIGKSPYARDTKYAEKLLGIYQGKRASSVRLR